MPTIVTDARQFTAARPWGARDLAEIDGASLRLHWSEARILVVERKGSV
jgi:hypothetical protein